ncbi:MAG: 2-oxoacid:acceptor oxidoreductase subunit alpha [Bdellovibrionales bacterium]|nr:2-oxoacid:acceptor oxidoreductase subunit alpha [Bdellovibrionales bacterium]
MSGTAHKSSEEKSSKQVKPAELSGGDSKATLEELDTVTIRFAGDSGDGMQLTGTQFTNTSAIIGNDIATFPDFPAEIRAPAGSLPGVSGFQINFSSHDVRTPGDVPNVLVAMNPAALKVHLHDLEKNGILILNTDAFTEVNLKKASYKSNPLKDGTLSSYRLFEVPITALNGEALKDLPLSKKEMDRCKNFFALGLMYWMYSRTMDPTLKWIESKFGKKPDIAEANRRALKAGYNFGETTEMFSHHFNVPQAKLTPGTYRQVTGNQALALGLVAGAQFARKSLIYCSYPITPASDILHDLSALKNFDVKTIQAEDEIAAIGAAIGASFGGQLGVTGTSGPGLALKSEALGLAVMAELPLVVVNVQRAGPSTGMPTKTEQADLLQAMFGRNGECPLAILAPATPSECFFYAIESLRIATKYMCPVILLTDGFLANGAEPWAIPDIETFKKFEIKHLVDANNFQPYQRDDKTLARPWVMPGTKGLEHRIGGLEKQDITGNVSYDPENHEKMTKLRASKIERITQEIGDTVISGKSSGKVLVVGWGNTYGAITTAVERLQKEGKSVSSIHLRHLNPFPKDLEKIFSSFEKILVPEINMGQLRMLLRSKYLVDAIGYNKVQGQPMKISEVKKAIEELL